MTRLRLPAWAMIVLLGVAAPRAAADPPDTGALKADADVLTMENAVAWALQHNPDLAVARRQRGIAEANVIIARTYPFNPVWQNAVLGLNGPADAGITNHVFVQNILSLELELRGQGKIRRAAASAALSKAEWEIATQELAISVRTIRAFNTFVYRHEKLRLLDDTIRLQQQTAQDAKRLFEQGKLKGTDQMLASSDLVEATAQRGPSQAALVAAWNELRRVIGVDTQIVHYRGELDAAGPRGAVEDLIQAALQLRPDLQALAVAVVEADQRVRLEVANRFGNITIGPKMEYNEARIVFVGSNMSVPLPVLNAHRGQIMLRQAELDKAMEDRRRLEVQAVLDVRAALARINGAQTWVDYFRAESLPKLQTTMEAFEKLFTLGDPSVDALKLIDARRRLLRGRDSHLDALWELSQARADLAAAVGDLGIALLTGQADPPPAPPVAPPAPPQAQRPALLPPVGTQ